MAVNNNISSNGWRAESMRMSAFPVPEAMEDDVLSTIKNWWSIIYADSPATHVNQDLMLSIAQLTGPVGDGFVTMSKEPVRFDLKYSSVNPANPVKVSSDASPPINFEELLDSFLRAAEEWLRLTDRRPLLRLAFGAVLLVPVDSRESGYEMLDAYLPDVRVRPDTSDFLYKINHRCPSKSLAGLQVNRLSTWMCQRSNVIVVVGGDPRPLPLVKFACRVELDINSVPTGGPLKEDRLPRVFSELVGFAKAIAHSGLQRIRHES